MLNTLEETQATETPDWYTELIDRLMQVFTKLATKAFFKTILKIFLPF